MQVDAPLDESNQVAVAAVVGGLFKGQQVHLCGSSLLFPLPCK